MGGLYLCSSFSGGKRFGFWLAGVSQVFSVTPTPARELICPVFHSPSVYRLPLCSL